MKELLGEMLETEGNWIGVLCVIGAVLGGFGSFLYIMYIWIESGGGEYAWYAWLALAFGCGIGGLIGGALAGIAAYIAICVSLAGVVVAIVFGGLWLFGMLVVSIFS